MEGGGGEPAGAAGCRGGGCGHLWNQTPCADGGCRASRGPGPAGREWEPGVHGARGLWYPHAAAGRCPERSGTSGSAGCALRCSELCIRVTLGANPAARPLTAS